LGNKEEKNQTVSMRKRLIGRPFGPKKATVKQINDVKLSKLLELLKEDTKGFPTHKLPIPFRRMSTKVYFRH
ncbi:MAG: hypothetical protein P8Y23_14955, partial [Candidatus Lokiarchaeota archaeon]